MKIQTRRNVMVVDAVDGEDLLGCANVIAWRDGYFLFRLNVKVESRRRGVGTAIVKQAICNHPESPIYVEPAPFNGDPMSAVQLADWYERMGFQLHELQGVRCPLMRYLAPVRMDRFELRKMVNEAMKNPDTQVLAITYQAKDGTITHRSISPIRFEKAGTLLSTCCGRGEPRQFVFEQIITAKIRPASDVLMPEGVN